MEIFPGVRYCCKVPHPKNGDGGPDLAFEGPLKKFKVYNNKALIKPFEAPQGSVKIKILR